MKRFVVLCSGLCLAMLLTGCVNPKMTALEKQLGLAEVENQGLESKIRELQDELEAQRNAPPPRNQADLEKINNLVEENKLLANKIADFKKQIRELGVIPDKIALLPADVDEALADLAAANPGLMTYNKERGMIKLANDVTFASGSAVVKSGAVGALNQLAGILNRNDVSLYDIVVAGHTDNVKISKASTKQKHPTNWHLSSHRAIGVVQILAKAGVSNERLSAKGFGEYDPIVPNSNRGAEANRRVEVFLVKASRSRKTGAKLGLSPAAAAPKVPAKQPDPVDSAVQYK